jgi:hypothetical protein
MACASRKVLINVYEMHASRKPLKTKRLTSMK